MGTSRGGPAPPAGDSGVRSRTWCRRTGAEDVLFERSGPFSAIEPIEQWIVGRDPGAEFPVATGAFEVAVGRHGGCPYEIAGVPAGMESARQVWLTPVGEYVSCADGWFAVDLFVVDGAVAAVTVELGSP